jgi:hypothetical protein
MRSPKTRILDVELKTDFEKAYPEFDSAMDWEIGTGKKGKILERYSIMLAIPFPQTGGIKRRQGRRITFRMTARFWPTLPGGSETATFGRFS